MCPSGVSYGRGLEAARERLFAGPRPRAPRADGARRIQPRAPLAPAVHPGAGASRHRNSSSPGRRRAPRVRHGHAGGHPSGRGRSIPLPGSRSQLPAPQFPLLSPCPSSPAPQRRPLPRLRDGHPVRTRARRLPAAPSRPTATAWSRSKAQACCGALHEHAGDRAAAEALARRNVAALAGAADFIVVNSAGLRRPAQGLRSPARQRAGGRRRRRVRDVQRAAGRAGPRPGRTMPLDVVYDAPCHLQHAQRVQAAPLAVLRRDSRSPAPAAAGLGQVLRQRRHLHACSIPPWPARCSTIKIAGIAAAEPRPPSSPPAIPAASCRSAPGSRAAGLAHPGGPPGRAAGRELPPCRALSGRRRAAARRADEQPARSDAPGDRAASRSRVAPRAVATSRARSPFPLRLLPPASPRPLFLPI